MPDSTFYSAANAILIALGATPTNTSVNLLVAWISGEKSSGNGWQWNNPLNTTQPATGSVNVNSVGVKSYPDQRTGVDAVAQTLRNGNYPALLKGLMNSDYVTFFSSAAQMATWGTSYNVVYQVFSQISGVTPPESALSSTPTALSGDPGTASFYSPMQNLAFPQTSLSVVPGSAAYGDVLFGRKWQVIVSDLNGDTALDVSQLHISFELNGTYLPPPPFATVTIYNLSPETENAIISEGYRCIISAGYTGSRYGQLMDFNVIQPIRYKENGTDTVLTLVGMDSDVYYAYSVANFSLLRGQNSRAVIGRVASAASIPTDVGILSPQLTTGKQFSRGKVVFGLASDIMRQIAKSENMSCYTEDGKINFIHPSDLPTDEIIDLTPETGLIGVPEQQEYGVSMQMLLDPRIKIGSTIHIDNSLVRNQQYATGQPVFMLDQDGLYRVITYQHAGDSRDTPWYTNVTTVGQSGKLPDMISSGGQNPL